VLLERVACNKKGGLAARPLCSEIFQVSFLHIECLG
jgi:hypothetical protein